MTSATLVRNYRMVAEAILAATMPPTEITGDAVMDRAFKAIDESAVAGLARHIERERASRRAFIGRMIDNPALFWSHLFWRDYGFHPVTTADLARYARNVRRSQRHAAKHRRYAFDGNRLAAAREMEIVARYFRRYGKRVWLREDA